MNSDAVWNLLYICIYQNSKSSVLQLLSLTRVLFAFCHLAPFQAAKSILSWLSFSGYQSFFVKFLVSAVFHHGFTHKGMETWCFCLLETTAGQYLTCCALSLCVSLLCALMCLCLLPAEMSSWSQLLVQCATYCTLRGNVPVHALMCVYLFSCMQLALGLQLSMCSGNSWWS